MSDITIALDAGHGGSDPGATYNGRAEKDGTLRLTRAVGKILEMNGINVYYDADTAEPAGANGDNAGTGAFGAEQHTRGTGAENTGLF